MKWSSLFDLNFDNRPGIWLALIPALVNIGVLVYVLLRLPPKRMTFAFSLFVFALTVWQLNDTFVRASVTQETAMLWSKLLTIGALLIAPAGMHFTLYYTGRYRRAKSLLTLVLLYIPVFLVESFTCAGLNDMPLVSDPYWGWLPATAPMNPVLLFELIWIPGLSMAIFILLLMHAFQAGKTKERRNQAMLIAIGFAIPTIQGTITQVILPELFHVPSVPLASTFMTFFSLATIISLAKYRLFQAPLRMASDIVLDTMTDFLFICAPDGRLMFINPVGAKTLNMEKAEIENYSVRDLFHESEEDYQGFTKEVWEKLPQHKRVESYATNLCVPGKEKIPVLISATLIPGAKSPEGILLLAHDISRQQEAENSLVLQTAIYESLLRAQSEMGEGVAISEGSRHIYVNDAMCRLTGYTREELLSMGNFFDLVHPSEREKMVQKFSSHQSGPSDTQDYGETILRRKNGQYLYVAYSFKYFDKDGRRRFFSIVRDISEAKEAEESLKQQSALYQSLLQAQSEMGEGVSITEGMRFAYVNEALCNIYGYSKEELMQLSSFLDIVVPEKRDELIRRFSDRFRGDENTADYGETSIIHKSGRIVHIAYSLKILQRGDEQQVFSIVRDITGRKIAEQNLLHSRAQLATAQQLAHIGSWEWNPVQETMTCSEEMYRIFGMEPSEKGITFIEFLSKIHPGDRDFAEKELQEAAHDQKPFDFHHRIVRPDGTVRILHAKGEISFNEMGMPVHMFGTGQDVTDILHENEMEKLVVAATRSFNSVIIADREGRIEWVNDGFTKLSGYTLEDVKGTRGEVLRSGQPTGLSEGTEHHDKVVKQKTPVMYESKNFAKDGTEYWVLTTLTPVLGQHGEVQRIIAIDSNITERIRIEEELILANKIAEHSLKKGNKALNELMKAKRDLEESMRVKEQFLAKMSHEIRTPMNAIVGLTDLLLEGSVTLEQKECLEAIKLSADNLLSIINDILDFSKLESGKVSLDLIPFQLREVIEGVMLTLRFTAVKKGLSMSMDIPDEGVPPVVIGDPVRLRQILLNLASNSVKFTEKGTVCIELRPVSEEGDDVTLEFIVRDTGIGVPEDRLSTIFESFTQASNETSRKYGGTGLGLTIVRQLAELQGGSVRVESKVGDGSVFYVRLPFKKAASDVLPEKVDEKTTPDPGLGKVKVLLAEDNEMNRMLALKVFNKWGFEADIAENGKIAVDKLKRHEYDIVLMDIQMPELDGYEATRIIRDTLPHEKASVPIIAITAHAFLGEAEKCISAGMDDYISKPFNQKVLYEKIGKLLRKDVPDSAPEPPVKQKEMGRNGERKTDLTYLSEIAEGNSEFIRKMIDAFLVQTPRILEDMTRSLEQKRWSELRGSAHKMKPSLDFVGIHSIKLTVRNIEKYAAEGGSHPDLLPSLVDEVKRTCDLAMEELREEILKFS